MKVFQIGSMLLLLSLSGCMSGYKARSVASQDRDDFESREDFLEYLMEGYVKGVENLYPTLRKGERKRLEKLHKALGWGVCDGVHIIDKGQLLIFRKIWYRSGPNKLSTLVLSANAPPKLIGLPKDLWDGQSRVFRHTENNAPQPLGGSRFRDGSVPGISCSLNENDYLQFYNGHIIDIGPAGARMDEDEQFLCYRTIGKAPDGGDSSNLEVGSIYIISVDHPEIKVQSRLEHIPVSIVVDDNKLLLGMVMEQKERSVFHFEIFDITGNSLTYVKDYYVNPPNAFAVVHAGIWDYDYQTNSQRVSAWRPFPFSCDEYVYNYDDNSLKKLPDVGLAKFINPDIFKNSVQYIDLEKLR